VLWELSDSWAELRDLAMAASEEKKKQQTGKT
jgi:hypothetical protein